jgi:putative ABC transport system substrate-binding protein
MSDMGRREFAALAGGAGLLLAAKVWRARAEQPAMPVIGFLSVRSPGESASVEDAFRKGLSEAGYVEGQNVHIAFRWAEGRYDRLPELAAELAKANISLVVTHSTPGTHAAKQATSTIPIVFAAVADPIQAGLVATLHRPGGNLTGLTLFLEEVSGKCVELIKEALPALTWLAVLFNPTNAGMLPPLASVQRTANALGVELVRIEVKGRGDIAAGVAAAAKERASALVVIEEPLTISNARQIADLALQSRLPMIGFAPQAEAGALMEYGTDLVDLYPLPFNS